MRDILFRSWGMSSLLVAVVLGLPAAAGAQTRSRVQSEEKVRVRVPAVQVIEVDKIPGRHAIFLGDHLARGYIGVELMPLTDELRQHFGVPKGRGVMISRLVEGGPAATAGLEVGDIITEVGDSAVERAASISSAIRGKETGEMVDVAVWRDGRRTTYAVEVAERERRVINIESLPHLEGIDVDVDVKEALSHVRRYFDGGEWQARVKRLESMDWRMVEERMKEVEERLRELESRLESEAKGDK